MGEASPPPDSRDPAPPGGGDAAPSLLRSTTSFIGRAADIDAVVELVRKDDVRLVTLTGPGGIGKTRLALQIADALQRDGHQTWFVSLAAIRDPEVAPVTIAEGVGVRSRIQLTAEQAVQETLRHQQGLLVLDNFEQILPAADQLPGLLDACPQLTVLVTSRVPLNLSAERVYAVGPLGEGTSANDSDAVRLFVERARAHQGSFALDAGNVDAVHGICQGLGGLPLAIELAAARVAVLSPHDILDRLGDALSLLTSGPPDAPARQRTIRDTIAWSYDLLEPHDQELFRRLGVLAGGCTFEAASAVTGWNASVLLDGLTALATASLLNVITSPDGTTRYAMLDTVRAFALERLARDDDEPGVRLAHARHYMALAESVIPDYDGPGLFAANHRMHLELDNARAAIGWCIDAGEREIAVRLAGALWRPWITVPLLQGVTWIDNIAEGQRLMDEVLRDREGLPVAALTEALTGAAHFSSLLGNFDHATELGVELAIRARAEGDRYAQYWALAMLGRVAIERDRFALAARMLRAQLAIAPVIRDSDNQAAGPLTWLGYIDLERGDVDAATRHLDLALGRSRACGNPLYTSWILLLLGRAARETGEMQRAFTHLHEGYEVARHHHLLFAMEDVLLSLAIIALQRGKLEYAQLLLGTTTFSALALDTRREYNAARDLLRQVAGDQAARDIEQERRIPPDDPKIIAVLQAMRAELDDGLNDPTLSRIHGGLTPRELDVVRFLAAGKSNRAIADALSISERRVENHVLHILTKLNVDSRTEAATWAVRNGLAE